jgi:thiol peroxidase
MGCLIANWYENRELRIGITESLIPGSWFLILGSIFDKSRRFQVRSSCKRIFQVLKRRQSVTERAEAFIFFGPRALLGPELKAGDPAPDFKVVGEGLKEYTRADFAGKPMLISVVPSLDTGTCSIQTKRFNDEAGKLGDSIAFLTISADLPFAQKRYCGAEGVANLTVLSDFRDMDFALHYGTYIKDVRLNSRAVFVVDQDGIIRYAEYVPTAGQQPNYEAALERLKGAVA